MNNYSIEQEKFSLLTHLIQQGKKVEFMHNQHYYEIFTSAIEGYVINVYSDNSKDKYGEYLQKNILDGGICSGSAEDALVFML